MKKLDITQLSYLAMALGIIIFSAFFLGLPYLSFASETVVIQTGYDNDATNATCYDRNNWQSFTGTGEIVTKIQVQVDHIALGYPQTFKICDASDCSGDIFYTAYTGAIATTAIPFWYTVMEDYVDYLYFENGITYYIVVKPTGTLPACPSTDWALAEDEANTYTGGQNWTSAIHDNNYKFYNDNEEVLDNVDIVEIPDWPELLQVGEAYLNYQDPKTCIIGYECRLRFDYTYDDNDHYFILTNNLYGEWYDIGNPVDEIQVDTSSTTLLLDWFDIPATTTPITQEFCITEMDEDYEPVNLYCNPLETGENTVGPTIEWVYPGVTGINDFFDLDCSCSDIATTTAEGFVEEWANSFNWGFQCGLRKLTCWAFMPSESSVLRFTESYYSVSHDFPFDIVNQFNDEMYAIATSTINATTSQAFTINIGELTGIDDFDEDLVFASADMMSDNFGELWTKVYSLLEYVVYMFGAFWIFSRVFSLGGNQDMADFKNEVGGLREDKQKRKLTIDLRKK